MVTETSKASSSTAKTAKTASTSKTNKTESEDSVVATVYSQEQQQAANEIITKYSKWSFGIGLIPAPVVDMVALAGVQVKMISEIAKVYNVEASNHRIRAVVGSVINAGLPQYVGGSTAGSAVKSIPVIGPILTLGFMPTLSSAATYAMGAAFVKHFESGGTFLHVDTSALGKQVNNLTEKFKKDKEVTEADLASEEAAPAS